MKNIRTPQYNYNFNINNGYFERWGNTTKDDPQYSPVGPEILDMEISTICHGGCKFCYKSNTSIGKNMSFKTFKTIVDKMPMLTQIAFGIGDFYGNPDLEIILSYCRNKNIVPNITVNGFDIDDNAVNILSKYCGAVAVSNYGKEPCYGTVEKLCNAGMKQINIHQLLSEETFDKCLEVVEDSKNDTRLKDLNAIVFLSLKQRGRGENFHRVSDDKFRFLIDKCLEENIRFGFDSCTANKFINVIKNNPQYKYLEQMAEPCESGLFSAYINVDGIYYPCSFSEDGVGLDVVNLSFDFLNDIWYNEATIAWRKDLISGNRNCPIYKI